MLNRRHFLGLGAACLALPRFARAGAPNGRRFLFIHAKGGWDTTFVFQPNFGGTVEMEADATAAEVNGVPFVDSAQRPNVRAFLEAWGDRTCFVNGVEVRAISHERCTRIVQTGNAETGGDDWAARLAGNAADAPLLPYVVLGGTAFTSTYADRVVRVGTSGQLGKLLDGAALGESDTPVALPSATAQGAIDTFLRARTAALAPKSPFATAYDAALADVAALGSYAGALDIGSYGTGCQQLAGQLSTVWDIFGLGLARCALLEYSGWCSTGWDTHSQNSQQSLHYDELFEHLGLGLADLATRTGVTGAPLADEVCIVVFSEMGRTPWLNGGDGRDHWTFTSTMLIGAGVAGGRAVGGFDADGYGAGCDYATGDVVEGGPGIQAANVGATVLALGDVDPGEDAPLDAVLA